MLSIYDIKQQRMLDQPDFLALIDDYRTFAGVSFVGSFKIIEQELLPRFKQVDLILGMEDRKTGRSLAQVFNLEDKLAELQKAGAPSSTGSRTGLCACGSPRKTSFTASTSSFQTTTTSPSSTGR
ncbi:hypothetical protein AAEZ42_06730 [Limosilactobacillus fermentum]